MAMGAVSVTVPAVVAAAVIYFVDQSHSKAQEMGGRMRASSENMVEKVKTASEMPKLAPQLDGVAVSRRWKSPSFYYCYS